ncbi:hypothetical protein [Desulfovibrio sp. An276]|nr:hypothetical protein [Desulfovibrio sp. An276]
MTSITFDTLAYSKKLTKLGFTQEQAEGFPGLPGSKMRSTTLNSKS